MKTPEMKLTPGMAMSIATEMSHAALARTFTRSELSKMRTLLAEYSDVNARDVWRKLTQVINR